MARFLAILLLALPLAVLAQTSASPGPSPTAPAQTYPPSTNNAQESLRTGQPSVPPPSELEQARDRNLSLSAENERLRALLTKAIITSPPQTGLAGVIERYPVVPIALPLFASLLALLALGWSIYTRARNKAEYARQKSAWERLDARITKLQSQSIPLPQPVQRPTPVKSAPRQEPRPRPQLREQPQPQLPDPPREFVAPVLLPEPTPVPVTLTPQPEPVSPAAPAKWLKTNDLAADYNLAGTLGLDAEDAFQSAYRPTGLSCANLNDLRKDPQAVLRFEESGRGNFLAVDQGAGNALIVPAFSRDLEAARASIEGVFSYSDSLRRGLHRPAAAVFSAGLWTLHQPGEIGLG